MYYYIFLIKKIIFQNFLNNKNNYKLKLIKTFEFKIIKFVL